MHLTKKILFRFYAILTFFEGVIVFQLLFQIPSEGENAWLFGFSRFRIALGIFTILVTNLFLLLFLLSFRKDIETGKVANAFRTFLKMPKNLLICFVSCVFLSISLGLLIFLLWFRFPFLHFNTIWFLFQKTSALFYWANIIFVQSAFYLYFSFFDVFRKTDFWDKKTIQASLLILFILAASLFHWLVFITQDGFFSLIDGWYWQYHFKPYTWNDLLFPLFLAFSIALALFLFKKPKIGRINLLLIVFLGYFLQIGMGFIEGGGFNSIQQKFIESGHNHYATHASDDPNFLEALRVYEGTYTTNFILGTKPPGGLAFYMLAQKLSNLVNPVDSFDGRYSRLIQLAGYLFPLLAAITVVFIVAFMKRICLEPISLLAGLIFCFSPNFILIVLQMDQFLYPSMCLIGLMITYQLTRQPSFFISLLLGFYFYICLYMTFSLIPLISLCAFWLGFYYWFYQKNRSLVLYLKLFSGVAISFLLTYLSFYFFLNYDAFERYQNALAWHRTIKLFNSDFSGILKSVIINNLEYILWCGAPLVILSVAGMYECIRKVIKKEATSFDWFGVAFLANFMILNFAGQTRSEVGRLWFFLVPLLAIFAANCFDKNFKKNTIIFSFLLCVQLITTFITFKYQDFY